MNLLLDATGSLRFAPQRVQLPMIWMTAPQGHGTFVRGVFGCEAADVDEAIEQLAERDALEGPERGELFGERLQGIGHAVRVGGLGRDEEQRLAAIFECTTDHRR